MPLGKQHRQDDPLRPVDRRRVTLFSDAMFAAVSGLVINARTCLGDRHLKAMGLDWNDVEHIVCIIRDAHEAERLTNAIVNGDDAILQDLEERARNCIPQSNPARRRNPRSKTGTPPAHKNAAPSMWHPETAGPVIREKEHGADSTRNRRIQHRIQASRWGQ